MDDGDDAGRAPRGEKAATSRRSPYSGLECVGVGREMERVGGKPICWPHAPVHRLSESGTFLVTASTYRKVHYFANPERLSVLHRGLLKVAENYGWHLEAWAVLSNHYHFVGHSPPRTESLSTMLKELHGKTAQWINRLDNVPGRHVWHNFRETQLTYEKSYLARLNYTHQNAVKHGLVSLASQYLWCSATWFESIASSAQVNTIYSFNCDTIHVSDDYNPTLNIKP